MADLGQYLGIIDLTSNFKGLDPYFVARKDLGESQFHPINWTSIMGGEIKWHELFVSLVGTINIAVKSNKPKAVALAQMLSKKVLKIQEEDQRTIAEHVESRILLKDDLLDSAEQLHLCQLHWHKCSPKRC